MPTMSDETPELLYDENVLPAVIKLIEQARRQIVLVSPYNDFSNTLRGAVITACKKPGLRVVVVGRKDQADKERAHFDLIADAGAEIHLVERLHSKIYINESTAIVTSMNLSQGSAVNSREIAFRFTNPDVRQGIVSYIKQRLLEGASQWSTGASQEESWRNWVNKSKTSTRPPLARSPRPQAGLRGNDAPIKNLGPFPTAKRSRRPKNSGTCIRCGTNINYDALHPLCEACFGVWNNFGEASYIEKQCHRCGQDWETNYAKPLCYPCYQTVSGS